MSSNYRGDSVPANHPLLVPEEVTCARCKGSGLDRGGWDCLNCDGNGTVIEGQEP